MDMVKEEHTRRPSARKPDQWQNAEAHHRKGDRYHGAQLVSALDEY